MNRRTGILHIVSVLLLALGVARAEDFPLEGDFLRLHDDAGNPERRAARFVAKRELNVIPGLGADPRAAGATLEITGLGAGDGSSGVIFLAPALWRGIDEPAATKGYVYSDPDRTTGVRKVIYREGGTLKISARGASWPYAITQAQGTIRVRFQVGTSVHCTDFFTFSRNEAGEVVGRRSPRPIACGAVVCGDGKTEGSEECDDGGTADGDGCSAGCELESAGALCAGITPVAGTSIIGRLIATGLRTPTHIAAAPLDPNRLFILEQHGVIRIIENGNLLATPFLDIRDRVQSGGEQGLFAIAFHPQYAANGRFFLHYTGAGGDTVIARYQVSGDPNVAGPSSEKILLTVDQPFDNHNGGQIAFDAAGYLYLGLGDGGHQGDPGERGQSDATLLAKILRFDIDVDTPPYYAVPPDNPNAAAGDPLGLIWAKGLRNPWRFSFDRLTGDLYVGDVGGSFREEVDFTPASSTGGENYGWNIFEGTRCADPQPDYPDCPDPPTGFAMPVHEYTHSEGCSITGGFVYRGCRLPDLRGTYFYADLCSAFVRTFTIVGGVAQNHADRTADLAPTSGVQIGAITSFGEDARGELYIADYGGQIFKIIPAP